MDVRLPHHYRATVSRSFASRARVHPVASSSPEHLLLSSLGLSMLTTFEAFAARDGIEVRDWNATLDGSVERSPDGMLFTSIILCLDLELTGNVDEVDKTLDDTKQACLVLNSLRVPVVVETTIRTPATCAVARSAS